MKKMTSARISLTLIAALVAMVAIACGGDGDSGADPTATSQPAATATSVPGATGTPSGLVGDVARGEDLFDSESCSACHSKGDNRLVGPGLKGVGTRAEALGGDAYLIESIKDPNAVIVDGFNAVMTSFGHLDDQTVADLVAYLNTLN